MPTEYHWADTFFSQAEHPPKSPRMTLRHSKINPSDSAIGIAVSPQRVVRTFVVMKCLFVLLPFKQREWEILDFQCPLWEVAVLLLLLHPPRSTPRSMMIVVSLSLLFLVRRIVPIRILQHPKVKMEILPNHLRIFHPIIHHQQH